MSAGSHQHRDDLRRSKGRTFPAALIARLNQIAAAHKLTPAELLAEDQHAPIIRARRELIKAMRHEFNMSAPRIGRLLLMHHTTVLYHAKWEPPKPHDFSVPDESGAWAI